MQRFTNLDAFRGVAALGVAVHHWAHYTIGADAALLGDLYLFIDFFFVLSGFIIAAMYRDQITDGASTLRFLLFRIARLYPVHAFMLAAFLAVATISAALGGARWGAEMSAESFAANLLLIQSFGQFDGPTWNQPAWTIAVEFQLCILFALLCLAGIVQSALGRICLGAAVAATLFYLTTQHDSLNITTGDAFGRGFAGFATGVLLHSATAARWVAAGLSSLKARAGTGVEIAALAAVAAYLALAADGASFLAPFAFAGLIVIFLNENGAVSRALGQALFARLGALGYAIYMAHFLFIPPMQALVAGGGLSAQAALLCLPVYLSLTICLAFCIHRLVEAPTRDAMRLWIDRRLPPKAAPVRIRTSA